MEGLGRAISTRAFGSILWIIRAHRTTSRSKEQYAVLVATSSQPLSLLELSWNYILWPDSTCSAAMLRQLLHIHQRNPQDRVLSEWTAHTLGVPGHPDSNCRLGAITCLYLLTFGCLCWLSLGGQLHWGLGQVRKEGYEVFASEPSGQYSKHRRCLHMGIDFGMTSS